MRWSRAGMAVCLCIVLPAMLMATEPEGHTSRRIELPWSQQHGPRVLVLSAPSSWRSAATHRSEGALPTIVFLPESGRAFSLVVDIIPLKPEKLDLSNIKKGVKGVRDRTAKPDGKQEIEIRDLQGTNNLSGYYFSAPNKDPKKEWRYVTFGAAVLRDLSLTFALQSNDPAQPEVAETLEMIKGATITEPAIAKITHAEIAIPNQTWAISFDAPALSEVKQAEESAGFYYSGNSYLFNLSFFVEEPHGKGTTHVDCRDYYWAKMGKIPNIERKSIVFSETDRYARVQFDVAEPARPPLPAFRQTHVHYYFIYGGKWVDVHISLVNAAPDDQIFKTFDASLSYGPSGDLEIPSS